MSLLDLARRLKASPRWRWSPAMRVIRNRPFQGALDGGRIVRASGELVVAWESGSFWPPSGSEWLEYDPDLEDAGTAGVLFSWLSWGDDDSLWPTKEGWVIRCGEVQLSSPSFGEVVARALLAQWEKD